MSVTPIAPIGPVAMALRVQAISAVETKLMDALDTVQSGPSQQAGRTESAETVVAPPPPAAATKPVPVNPVRQAADVARAAAATRQAGAAPLFADLAQAEAAPALPPTVRAAIGQLLSLPTPLAAMVTAETVKQAVARSGLFLEAHLADPSKSAQPGAPDLKAALLTLQRALVEVPAAAGGRQPPSASPPAPDLAQAMRDPNLPAPVKAAISQLLALPAPARGAINAETVKLVLSQSGLVLGSLLKDSAKAAEAPPAEQKALATLQRALSPAPAAAQPPTARPTATPPPVREAALSAQPPLPATLSTADPAPVIVQHLQREVEQAVARQVLHQLASLPESPTGAAWMFELPVATPQGTALAQFEIERDGAQAAAGDPTESWRLRFSIDVDPLGPVHVHLGLDGGRAAVTVWAERDEGLLRLRSLGGELAAALPADVVFHPGAPRRPVPQSGQFVDQSS